MGCGMTTNQTGIPTSLDKIGESREEYLKTLCQMGAGASPVSVSRLATQLGISTVSVHQMVRKLSEQGLLSYEPHLGISLRPRGGEIAAHVLRRHRLWERFLHDVLGLPWSMVHLEAGRLEHATSPGLSDKLAAFLDNPHSCPHGNPIENDPCRSDEEQNRPLFQSDVGDKVLIASIPENDLQVLESADQMGLRPGAAVHVIEKTASGGMIIIIDGQRHDLTASLAQNLRIASYQTSQKVPAETGRDHSQSNH